MQQWNGMNLEGFCWIITANDVFAAHAHAYADANDGDEESWATCLFALICPPPRPATEVAAWPGWLIALLKCSC